MPDARPPMPDATSDAYRRLEQPAAEVVQVGRRDRGEARELRPSRVLWIALEEESHVLVIAAMRRHSGQLAGELTLRLSKRDQSGRPIVLPGKLGQRKGVEDALLERRRRSSRARVELAEEQRQVEVRAVPLRYEEPIERRLRLARENRARIPAPAAAQRLFSPVR